jgi:uncharacterized protein (DUF1697 family)
MHFYRLQNDIEGFIMTKPVVAVRIKGPSGPAKRYAVFLRAVNVGGTGIIAMDEIRRLLVKNGYQDVVTRGNSGNIALTTTEDGAGLKVKIEKIFESAFGTRVALIIKDRSSLERIIAQDPFSESETDNAKRLVAMLEKPVDGTSISVFENDPKIVESLYLKNDLLYIYYKNGVGRSKFSNSVIEKKLGVVATSRNWNTVEKMVGLLKER